MAIMNVSLSEPMSEWVEAQARSGRFGDASEYIGDLIRRDQERAATLAELQDLVTEGLESGVSDRSVDDILQTARERVRSALQR